MKTRWTKTGRTLLTLCTSSGLTSSFANMASVCWIMPWMVSPIMLSKRILDREVVKSMPSHRDSHWMETSSERDSKCLPGGGTFKLALEKKNSFFNWIWRCQREQVLAWGGHSTGVRKKYWKNLFIFQLDIKMSAGASAWLRGKIQSFVTIFKPFLFT